MLSLLAWGRCRGGDLKDSVKESIRIRAAVHGRSRRGRARAILEQAAGEQEAEEHLYLRVRRLVEKSGPMDIDFLPREELTGAQFITLSKATVDKYGPLDIEIPPRGPSHREISGLQLVAETIILDTNVISALMGPVPCWLCFELVQRTSTVVISDNGD